jgi:CRP-like cAMP-binding protein
MLDKSLLQSPRLGPVERVLFLRRVRGFTTLPPADLAVLGECARERVTKRGAALLRAGEPVSAVHLILEGRVRIRRRGRELGIAERGVVVGGGLLLSRDPEGLEAVAQTDTVTLELDRESVLDALEDRFGSSGACSGKCPASSCTSSSRTRRRSLAHPARRSPARRSRGKSTSRIESSCSGTTRRSRHAASMRSPTWRSAPRS